MMQIQAFTRLAELLLQSAKEISRRCLLMHEPSEPYSTVRLFGGCALQLCPCRGHQIRLVGRCDEGAVIKQVVGDVQQGAVTSVVLYQCGCTERACSYSHGSKACD